VTTPDVGDLPAMFAEMERAPAIVQPSDFWTSLNERNLSQLDDEGFAHFKRTINQNYFGWVPQSRHDDQVQVMLKEFARRPAPRIVTARLGDVSLLQAGPDRANPYESARGRLLLAFFLAMSWEYVRRRDPRGLLDRLDEPALGDPVAATYRGRRISQDVCNSVHELYSATAGVPGNEPGPGGVLELGAGYGRVAWAFLEAFPARRYIVCDIPPALGIAQQYLTTLFPDRVTFRFRHFDDGAEVAGELAAAQLAFLTPNQLELLDPLGVSLFVNISSLHEMRPEQIAYYLGQVDRHTDGCFYTKQWLDWHNTEDDVRMTRDDYPIPATWETIYSHQHPIQRSFFHALYRVGAVRGVLG
jgi:putative sugar O-methyltransferase